MKKTSLIGLMLGLLLVAGLHVSLAARDAEQPAGLADSLRRRQAAAHPEQAQEMLDQARRAPEALRAKYEVGALRAEEVIGWSRRVLEAERAVAKDEAHELRALNDHWDRTDGMRRKIKALYETGARGGEAETYAAACYYAAEAELWLLDAGGEVPDEREIELRDQVG